MVKEFTFRGKTIIELKELSNDEFARLLTSRMRRSLARNIDKPLAKRVEKVLKEKKSGKDPKPVRTHKRAAIVLPSFVGLKFAVYNGHEFVSFEVQPEMLGHALGEFALTRKRVVHGKAGIGATKSSTAVTARG